MNRRSRRAGASQSVVRLSSPAELALLVPYLTGFRPDESIVVLSLHGPRRRLGLTVRHDLITPDLHDALAEDLVRRVRTDGATSAAVVVFTEQDDLDDRLPREDLVDRLVGRLAADGVETVDALLVRAGRWWSYECGPPCCPAEGTLLPAEPVGAAALYAAEDALRGRSLLPDRETLKRSVEGPVGLRLAVMQAAVAVARKETADRRRTLDLLSAAVRSAQTGGVPPDDADAARILVGLFDKRARDEAATWGLDRPGDALLAALTDLAQRAPDDVAAPVCTVLGSLSHGHGDGGVANVALARALRCDPDYTMARLAMQLLQGGAHPTTIRRTARAARVMFDRSA